MLKSEKSQPERDKESRKTLIVAIVIFIAIGVFFLLIAFLPADKIADEGFKKMVTDFQNSVGTYNE